MRRKPPYFMPLLVREHRIFLSVSILSELDINGRLTLPLSILSLGKFKFLDLRYIR
jgi:hypothetical protein